MGSFLDKLLGKVLRRPDPQPTARIFLGAFGKHPGWDDHIEDLGLDSDRLVAVKRILYVQGIAGNINSGAWEKLDPGERLDGFNHLFLWRTPRDVVVGRMWSSRDGKGRARYPMVVCAHCVGLPLDWTLQRVLPTLEDLERRCVATESAADVRAAMANARLDLRQVAQQIQAVAQPVGPSPRALADLAERPEMGHAHVGLHRVLYQIEREMSAYRPAGTGSATTLMGALRAEQLRVPIGADAPGDGALLWLRFLLTELAPDTPILIFWRLDQAWLDIIVGDPGVPQIYCLRAGLEQIPLTTDIPYSLDDAFRARAEKAIALASRHPAEVPSAPEPRTRQRPQPHPEPLAPSPPAAPTPAPEPGPEPRPEPTPERKPQPEPRPEPAARRRLGPTWTPPSRPWARVRRGLRKLWPLWVGIGAAIAVALILLAVLGRTPPRPNGSPHPPERIQWQRSDADNWRALCVAYYNWFGRLNHELSEPRRSTWRSDPSLKQLLAAIDASRRAPTDPRTIAHEAGGDLAEMADHPPEEAKATAGIKSTRQALATINAIDDAIRRGPRVHKLDFQEFPTRYRARGWSSQAQLLESAAAGLKRRDGPSVAQAIDDALALKPTLEVIEQRYAALRTQRETIKTLGDDTLTRVDEYLRDETSKTADLQALADKLEAVTESTQRIASVGQRIRTCEKHIEELAGLPLASRFIKWAKADIQSGASLVDMLKSATRTATQFEAQLARFKARQDAMKGLPNPVAAAYQQHARAGIEAAEDLDALLAAFTHAADAAGRITQTALTLKSSQKRLAGLNDNILRAFPKLLDAEIRAATDLKTLQAALASASTLAATLAEIARSDGFDHPLFLQQRTVRPNPDGTVTRQILEAWAAEAVEYVALPPKDDPRLPTDKWAKQQDELAQRIAFLRETGDQRDAARAAAAHTALGTATKAIADMLALQWVKKNEKDIQQRVQGCTQKLSDISKAIGQPTAALATKLNDIRKLPKVAEADAINKEWVRRRDAIVPANVTPEAVAAARKALAHKWHTVQKARDFLGSLDKLADAKVLPRGLPAAATQIPPSPAHRAFADAIENQRNQTLQKALAIEPWKDQLPPPLSIDQFAKRPEWRQLCEAYRRWRDDAGKLLLDHHRIETLLDAGYLLDDKPKGAPKSIRQLYEPWKHDEAYRALRAALPAAKRLDALIQLGKLEGQPLIAFARQLKPGQAPEIHLAIWHRLGNLKDWPATVDDLRLDRQVALALAPALRTIQAKDPARAQHLEQRRDAESLRRWQAGFHHVVLKADPKDLGDGQIADALALAAKIGVRTDALSPMIRFKIHLHALRQHAARLAVSAKKDAIVPHVEAFRSALAKLPPTLAGRPSIATLLAELDKLAKGTGPNPAQTGLAHTGPAASPLAAKCKSAVRQAGKYVDYTLAIQPGGRAHTLTFILIEPAGDTAPAPFYLATREVSVGLFINAVDAANAWAAVKPLLGDHSPTSDKRQGPRTWKWEASKKKIRFAQNWLFLEGVHAKVYPPGLAAGKPSARHPMQYVSPEAALFLARLLGCRLPTAAEWRAAYDAHARATAPRNANLRDRTWRDHHKHAASSRVPWPDAHIFLPKDPKARAAVPRGEDAGFFVDINDDVLWFDEAEPRGVMAPDTSVRHLIGNVAEFIHDDAAAFQKIGSLTPNALGAFLARNPDALKVVGGSALSPRELWKDDFSKAWTAAVKPDREGYADVGFRLAFPAPIEPVARRLKTILTRFGYPSDD